MALKVASPHRSEWNSLLFTQTFPRASSRYKIYGFPRPRPPRPPVRSLNLRGNEVDFPALRVVNNADLMRVVIGCHGPFVARVRDEPIPADPPLPPILAYPLLGYPPDRHYLVHTEELQLLANWMALHAGGPPVNEDEPPALNDGLPPAPIGDLPPAPIGWLVAFTINAVGNAAFATLVAAANAASATLLAAANIASAALVAAANAASATLVAASNTASATLVAASNAASATLVAASNAASATLVAAANAASATLVAAAIAASATLVAAAIAASATLVAAAIAASATLIAAANAASATLIAAASIITTAQAIPVWLVALVIGLSLALSISDEAYVNFFASIITAAQTIPITKATCSLDILRGALLSYGYDHIRRFRRLFRPSSRSIPRGALPGWVSMAFMYVRGFILEFGNSIAQRLPEFVTTRINTELTAFLIRFLLSISCTSSFVILVFRLLSR